MIRRIVLHTFLAALLIGGLGALYQAVRQGDGFAGPAAILAALSPAHEHDDDDD